MNKGQRLLCEEQEQEIEQLMEEVLAKWGLPDDAMKDLYLLYETGLCAGYQMEYSYPS
jgi:hypothetical protein